MTALALAAWLAGPAAAFSTGKPDDPGHHEKITEEALVPRGYDSISGGQVVAAVVATDAKEWTDPAAHFDSEAFKAGSARMNACADVLISALRRCDGPEARKQLGRILHAAQDFFSHSNWVETHEPDEFPVLYDMEDPEASASCDPETHAGGLTSGYFPDDQRPAKHKCVHAELHKDASSRPFFTAARAAALAYSGLIIDGIDRTIRATFEPEDAELRIRILKESALDAKAGALCD